MQIIMKLKTMFIDRAVYYCSIILFTVSIFITIFNRYDNPVYFYDNLPIFAGDDAVSYMLAKINGMGDTNKLDLLLIHLLSNPFNYSNFKIASQVATKYNRVGLYPLIIKGVALQNENVKQTFNKK